MLKINNVSAGYNGIDVINNIDFYIKPGESISIIGPNGCGKTTLLKAIAGIIPYKGDIFLDNINLKKLNNKEFGRKIAFLPQINNIYFSYTVHETVSMGRFAHIPFMGNMSIKDKEIVENILNLTGIYEIKDSQINSISGGQLQRVFLARAIAQEPEVIILDEPTNHLDLKHQKSLIDYLKIWTKSGKIAIGVFHDINLAIELSNDIILMNNGKILKKGSKKEVLLPNNLRNAYGFDINEYMIQKMEFWSNNI